MDAIPSFDTSVIVTGWRFVTPLRTWFFKFLVLLNPHVACGGLQAASSVGTGFNCLLGAATGVWTRPIRQFLPFLWRYSPFRALASLIRCLSSPLFAALLLHPLIRSSCRASLWTTSDHLVLGLPTDLTVWKFPFKTLFGILCSSMLIICPTLPSLLNLTL
jgi:hypothetical protein